MAKALNITGERFGMLVAKKDIGSRNGRRIWLCVCDCGGESKLTVGSLRSGNSMRCDGHRSETAKTTFTRHGAKANKQTSYEYVVWTLMRDRCNNPNNKSYGYYGGRGISIDPKWDDFSVFLSDMGCRPSGMTLDRIDSELGYSPTNCQWATRKQQSRNRKYCRKFVWNGQEQFLWKLAEDHGIPVHTMNQRLHRGWTLDRALNQPMKAKS